LALQRLAGNRAVTALLQGRDARAGLHLQRETGDAAVAQFLAARPNIAEDGSPAEAEARHAETGANRDHGAGAGGPVRLQTGPAAASLADSTLRLQVTASAPTPAGDRLMRPS